MKINKQSKNTLNEIVKIIENSGVVICRTDTVYGFLADVQNKKAVNKIYKIKNRPKSKPLPIFISNLKMAHKVAIIDEKQEKILKKFWPGKYTFILKRKNNFRLFGALKDTVALRIPKYKFLNDLLKKIDKPLVQTSVNISGSKTLKKVQDIAEIFKKEKRIELMIDGGNIKIGKSSKIFDLIKSKTLRK